jgi:hypothetical protein
VATEGINADSIGSVNPRGIMSASTDRITGLPFCKGSGGGCLRPYAPTVIHAELTFVLATYRGARDPDQGMIWWAPGSTDLPTSGALILSTATDELVEYPVRLTSQRFTFTDPAGCEVTYEHTTSSAVAIRFVPEGENEMADGNDPRELSGADGCPNPPQSSGDLVRSF